MRLFILLAFLVMAWGYWALSGGSDFQPETRAEAEPAAPAAGDADKAAAASTLTAAAPETMADAPTETPVEESSAAPDVSVVLDDVAAVQPTVAEPPAPQPTPPPAQETELPAAPLSAAEALAAIGTGPTAAPREETLEVASVNAGGSQRRVTADRVNVRQGPGVDFGVLDQVDAGDLAEVLEEDGGWLRIRTPGGTVGWMSARFLAGLDG